MAQKFTIRLVPVGGLDVDSDDSKVSPNDYRHAENMRNSVTYEGKQVVPCNMKGNLLIAYSLSSAESACVGSLEDKGEGTIFYFVWSSDGQHKILRYYPEPIDNNPLGYIDIIAEFDFGWLQDTRITGIDFIDNKLLYWTDNVKPRMINAVKASVNNKYKSWEVQLPISSNSNDSFQIVVKRLDGTSIAAIQVNANGTREEKFEQIATQINNSLSAYLTAESCDCKLNITENAVNAYLILFTLPDYKIVPQNWYGATLIERYVDACKYPAGCEPLPEYKNDATKNFNYVNNHVFFFRLGYEYDNFEESTLGPISNVIVNNQVCNEGSYNLFNYIDIDFNDPDLLNPDVWVILKKVGVYVKERNSGAWKKVRTLDICDFYDGTVAHFGFYNNENTTAVPVQISDPLYDDVPVQANAQKFVKNKLTYAGIKVGYDAPECVEAELDLSFGEIKQPDYVDITFIIRICMNSGDGVNTTSGGGGGTTVSKIGYQVGYSQFLDNGIVNILNRRGAVLRHSDPNYNAYPVYGGAFYDGVSVNQDGWNQVIPEGGFLVYLAGTPYYGISRQVNQSGLPVDEFGAIQTGAAGVNIDAIKAFLGLGTAPDSEIYQAVTIRAPKGKYVARVASHSCSFGDVLKKGKIYAIENNLYHLTSTNVFRINDANGVQIGVTEVIVDAQQDIYVGEIYIADTMGRNYGNQVFHSVFGYLIDATMFNALGQEVKAIGIENQTVVLTEGAFGFANVGAPLPTFAMYGQATYTDHNGYFFFLFPATSTVSSVFITVIGCDSQGISNFDQVKYLGGLGQVYDGIFLESSRSSFQPGTGLGNNVFTPPTFFPPNTVANILGQQEPQQQSGKVSISLTTREVVIVNQNPNYKNNFSTVIRGKFVDAGGAGVCCTNAVFERNGRQATSDDSGQFYILAFADGRHPINLNGPANQTWSPITVEGLTGPFACSNIGKIIFSSGDSCLIDLSITERLLGIFPYDINLTTVAPPYSITAWYEVGDILCTLLNGDFIKSAKRGEKYVFGLRYQDKPGRLCSVVRAGEMYIPYFGEDLNTYFPDKFPVGTFSSGYPIITWTLPANFKPPVWAHHYQWLRTRKVNNSYFLQWVLNDVKYIIQGSETGDPLTTTYSNFNANQIWLNIDNLIIYQDRHPNNELTYQFVKGQRIRFIADDKGTFFETYIDMEIEGIKDSWLKLPFFNSLGEIKTGMRVEIYNPKLDAQEDIFYECGECFECTAPDTDNNEHSVLTAAFKWGDTYWVKRNYPVNDTTDVVDKRNRLFVVESSGVSDFYPSIDEDLGRIGIITIKLRRLYRYNSFRVSDQYIPDTGVNGLNKFNNIDDVELGREFGEIVYLFVSGFVLGAVCTNKLVSNYLGAVQGTTPTGGMTISSQDGFVGDSRPLLGDFGSQHPGTIVELDGWTWGVDFEKGIAWKYDNNGTDVLSDPKRKMQNYFRNLSKIGVWDAVAGFDRFYGEYILTTWANRNDVVKFVSYTSPTILFNPPVPTNYTVGEIVEITFVDVTTNERIKVRGVVTFRGPTTITVVLRNNTTSAGTTYVFTKNQTLYIRAKGVASTVAYQKDKQRWTTYYKFAQESYCPIGTSFVSFNKGQLYLHDEGPINTFNGVYYPWKLTVALNGGEENNQVKLWMSVFLEQRQNERNTISNWSVPVVRNQIGQLSRIVKGAFARLEEYWHAWVRKDLNTLSVPDPILDGADLRSSTLVLEMENDATESVELRCIDVQYFESKGNLK